jgi:hypothetical protein
MQSCSMQARSGLRLHVQVRPLVNQVIRDLSGLKRYKTTCSIFVFVYILTADNNNAGNTSNNQQNEHPTLPANSYGGLGQD